MPASRLIASLLVLLVAELSFAQAQELVRVKRVVDGDTLVLLRLSSTLRWSRLMATDVYSRERQAVNAAINAAPYLPDPLYLSIYIE